MRRTKHFNYTRPADVQLNNGEIARIDTLSRRFRASAQMGVLRGFHITVNGADGTKIDVGPGEGYSGGKYKVLEVIGIDSGERISTFTDAASGYSGNVKTVVGQGLADYTSGTKNYVSLIYVETENTPLAEKYYPFAIHNTLVHEAYQVSVLAEADWNVLPLADKDLRILVAIVTAQGAGVSLNSANIDQVIQPKTHPTTTQPVNITGVTLQAISQETPIGTGTLRFETVTKKLFWAAPGDAEGIGVAVPSSGIYTLYSDSTTYWVDAAAVYASLPASDETDSITIETLYGRAIPMASAVDAAHRDMIGSGQPTSGNPHGMTLDDIQGGTFEHADLFHVNGISNDADPTQLGCVIDGTPGVDRVLITNLGGYNNSFLIDGNTYQAITGYAPGVDGVVSFDTIPAPVDGRWLIYLDSAANLQTVYIGEDLWVAAIQVVDMRNATAGAGTITWDAAAETLTWAAPGDAVGTAVKIVQKTNPLLGFEGYYKLYSLNGVDWVIINVNGNLGANNASVINIAMNSTDHPEDNLLRLCSVQWDLATETLSNLEDLRRFMTADNAVAFVEEHDQEGRHTKVLRQTLKVAVNGDRGIFATVEGNYGIRGQAALNTGLYGHAQVQMGVYGTAPVYGGYFIASNSGLLCQASAGLFAGDTALKAQALGATALYATAPVMAGYFAAANTVIKAVAAVDTAVWATARSYGVKAEANAARAVYGSAPVTAIMGEAGDSYGGYFNAVNKWGVFAQAPTTAAYAIAVGNTGGYFGAVGDVGVWGTAQVETGVAGVAPTKGVVGLANNTAGHFVAAAQTAVFGEAAATAIVGEAAGNVGVYGSAVGVEGGYFIADDSVGVYAVAGNDLAISGFCGANAATAIYGYAGNAAAGRGIVGRAGAGAACVGVYGTAGANWQAIGVQGTGGYGGYFNGADGLGNGIGVYASGASRGIAIVNTIDYTAPARATFAYVTGIPIFFNGTHLVIPAYATA